MTDPYVVGVDLGGSHVYAAVVNTDGHVVSTAEANIDRTVPPDTLLRGDIARTVKTAIARSEAPARSIRAIGMGLPGNIDREGGVCRFSPNFQWRDVVVAAPLEEALHAPVFLMNDVRSHTLGELHFGAGRGHESFVMFALGTGIGGGVVVGGTLIEGAHGAGGELGHITVDPRGPTCQCGNRGCVEALASGPAIVRAARLAVRKKKGGAILKLSGTTNAITPAHVARAAENGDATAVDIWEAAGRWLGVAVATVLTTVDAECVLIGGGVGQAGDLLLRPLRAEVARRFRMIGPGVTPIVPAALGEKAGFLGAAALALESVGLLEPALQKHSRATVTLLKPALRKRAGTKL